MLGSSFFIPLLSRYACFHDTPRRNSHHHRCPCGRWRPCWAFFRFSARHARLPLPRCRRPAILAANVVRCTPKNPFTIFLPTLLLLPTASSMRWKHKRLPSTLPIIWAIAWNHWKPLLQTTPLPLPPTPHRTAGALPHIRALCFMPKPYYWLQGLAPLAQIALL